MQKRKNCDNEKTARVAFVAPFQQRECRDHSIHDDDSNNVPSQIYCFFVWVGIEKRCTNGCAGSNSGRSITDRQSIDSHTNGPCFASHRRGHRPKQVGDHDVLCAAIQSATPDHSPIAEAIEQSTSLTTLDLTAIYIGSKGVSAIAEGHQAEHVADYGGFEQKLAWRYGRIRHRRGHQTEQVFDRCEFAWWQFNHRGHQVGQSSERRIIIKKIKVVWNFFERCSNASSPTLQMEEGWKGARAD